MIKLLYLIRRHKYTVIYLLLMFVFGAVQLVDWYFGSEDPLWHIFFYLFFMPAASVFYAYLAGSERFCLLIPFIAGLTAALIYIFMANGGLAFDHADADGLLWFSAPSFAAAFTGVLLRRFGDEA